VELRYLRKDGSAVSVSVFARRLDDAAGNAARIALVVEDITLRKQGEQRIQQLNADLERKVAERTQQLRETMRSWAERNQQLSLLAEMMGVLPAAR
ncbi:PAS domain S-box protein, partial [Enterococcus gallinarum]|uniref:PAS domain S-box protein n=1 Tax=Enterococcus gallinarum TaxID=1353 RepID=UPI003D137CAA